MQHNATLTFKADKVIISAVGANVLEEQPLSAALSAELLTLLDAGVEPPSSSAQQTAIAQLLPQQAGTLSADNKYIGIENSTLLDVATQQKLKASTARASKPRVHPETRPSKPLQAVVVPERVESVAASQHSTNLLLGKKIGPFRFTPKQPSQQSGGRYGGWEASCPFHRKNFKSGCRKWFPVCGPTLKDKQECAAAALDWCAAAHQFDRQWLHLAYQVDYATAVPAPIARRLPIFSEEVTGTRCIPDSELDKKPRSGAARSEAALQSGLGMVAAPQSGLVAVPQAGLVAVPQSGVGMVAAPQSTGMVAAAPQANKRKTCKSTQSSVATKRRKQTNKHQTAVRGRVLCVAWVFYVCCNQF